jgi:hypothetical protein
MALCRYPAGLGGDRVTKGKGNYHPNQKYRGRVLSPLAIERMAKHARAVQLRVEGHTFQEIADQVGYAHKNGAFLAVQRTMARFVREPSEQLLDLELARLDAALNALWPAVELGDTRSIDTMLRLMDRRAKYLGLDKPKESTLHVQHAAPELPEPDAAAHMAQLAEVLSKLGIVNVTEVQPTAQRATYQLPAGVEYTHPDSPDLDDLAQHLADDGLDTLDDDLDQVLGEG